MSLTLLSAAEQHYVEFPGLGWKFNISEHLIQIGSFSIKWYGALIALGFLLAVIYGLRRAKDFGLKPDPMIDIALLTTLVAFVGARLYYVFFSEPEKLADYLENPITILYIWEGGLGIYGGIIFAFVFGFLFSKLFKQSFLGMADIASLGFLIGQAVGRWGNFFNQEAFGGNTDLPWGMTGDIIARGTHGKGYSVYAPVHPTFLYESLWCILGFVLLHILSKKLYKFKGQIFCGYLIWYGIGRFFIEGLRTDSLVLGPFRISQLVAVAAVLLGAVLWIVLAIRSAKLAKLAPAGAADLPEQQEDIETAADSQQAATDAEEPTTNEEEPENGTED